MIKINSIHSITNFENWINYINQDVKGIMDIDQTVIDSILFHAQNDLTKLGLIQLTEYLEMLKND